MVRCDWLLVRSAAEAMFRLGRVRRLLISPGALPLVTADSEKGVFGRLDV